MEWMGVEPVDAPFALWFQAWIEGFLRFITASLVNVLLVVIAVAIVGAWAAVSVRRRFWCRLAQRDVEVLFERRGLLRRLASVRSCSAFEPATCVSCGRRCLDASYRRQWEAALPIRLR